MSENNLKDSNNFFVQGQLEITKSKFAADSAPLSAGPIPAGYSFVENVYATESAIIVVSMEGAYESALKKVIADFYRRLDLDSLNGIFNLSIQHELEAGVANRVDVFVYGDGCKRII